MGTEKKTKKGKRKRKERKEKNENGRFVGKENRDMKSLKKINRGLEIRRGLNVRVGFDG